MQRLTNSPPIPLGLIAGKADHGVTNQSRVLHVQYYGDVSILISPAASVGSFTSATYIIVNLPLELVFDLACPLVVSFPPSLNLTPATTAHLVSHSGSLLRTGTFQPAGIRPYALHQNNSHFENRTSHILSRTINQVGSLSHHRTTTRAFPFSDLVVPFISVRLHHAWVPVHILPIDSPPGCQTLPPAFPAS